VGGSFRGVLVGNQQRHILRKPDINLPRCEIRPKRDRFPPVATDRLRPYQGYLAIRMYLSDSTANTRRCSLYATKRKGDFMGKVSFTW